MWLVIAAVLLVTLAWICTVYIVQLRLNIPGPRPLPILGNIGLVKNGLLHEAYAKLWKQYGRLYLFFIGVDPVLVISDCQLAKEVTVKKFKAFHDRPSMIPVMSPKRYQATLAGMLAARGHLWTSLRAAAQPVFHANSLSEYARDMNTSAGMLVEDINKFAASGDAFNFCELAGKMTMRVILKCAFGVDMDTQSDREEHVAIKSAKQFFKGSNLDSMWFLLVVSIPKILRPIARTVTYAIFDFKAMEESRDVLFSMTNQLASSFCKATGLPPFVVDPEVLGNGAKLCVLPPDTVPSNNSIIAAMMHAKDRDTGEPLKPGELLVQGNTFILAGYETTAGAVSFCMYLLACNPEAERKLLQEIDACGRDACPTYQNLEDWSYAKACFREALRIFPVAALLARECVEATTIGGYAIPKGTYMHVDIMAMHHNPEYFPEPEAFRPERFVEAAAQGNPDLHPAYMPFGLGPHNCIGWRFAMEEGVIMLIRLYQKFMFRLSDAHHPGGALPIRSSITISPKDGLWLKAIPR